MKKTPAEMMQPAAGKRTRVRIRLKHSLAAGEEIHAMLPDTLEQFEAARARGEIKEVRARSIGEQQSHERGDSAAPVIRNVP